MLRAMVKDGKLYGAYKKSDIMEYIYRVYSDHEYIREIHPDARIRNINRYGISDIRYILEDALHEWQENATNNTLLCDERYIYIKDVNESGEELAKFTLQLSNMLLKKYFSIDVKDPVYLQPSVCVDDGDIEVFGKSLYRNRVFEDVQYCPLCEEIDTNMLRVVHILPSRYCESDAELLDKNNGMIMCLEHAEDYLNGRFWFEENGFVYNKDSDIVNEKMHLAIQIKNRKRREFISRYKAVMED